MKSSPARHNTRHAYGITSPTKETFGSLEATFEGVKFPLSPLAKTVPEVDGLAASRRLESAIKNGGPTNLKISVDENVRALEEAFNRAQPIDPRQPALVGQWERSLPYVHDSFAREDLDEPHLKRKHVILQNHPEIEKLYGVEPSTKYFMFSLLTIHLSMAYYVGRHTESVWFLLLAAYFVAGSITAMFGVFIHETTHNLMHQSPLANRLLGLVANMAIVFPISASFRRYHLEHHTYQGVLGRDADLPMPFEWAFVRGNTFLKLIWVSLFPIFYAMRGAVMLKRPQKWEVINGVWTLVICNPIYAHVLGTRGMVYLALGLFLGYGVHPLAAHFIQEHFSFVPGQETYSYYGFLNKIMFNIGYHNEHHDFIKVSWRNLPRVRAIAPEFYDTLAYHTSWVGVLWEFITRRDIGPQSRVARDYEHHREGRALLRNKGTTETPAIHDSPLDSKKEM